MEFVGWLGKRYIVHGREAGIPYQQKHPYIKEGLEYIIRANYHSILAASLYLLWGQELALFVLIDQ